jgi:hypothetical protein
MANKEGLADLQVYQCTAHVIDGFERRREVRDEEAVGSNPATPTRLCSSGHGFLIGTMA